MEGFLTKKYKELGITTGDITPPQSVKWGTLVTKFSELIDELIELNQEE